MYEDVSSTGLSDVGSIPTVSTTYITLSRERFTGAPAF